MKKKRSTLILPQTNYSSRWYESLPSDDKLKEIASESAVNEETDDEDKQCS